MEKKKILTDLIKQLEDNLDVLVCSALAAKDAATNEESVAENKYDTQGLEASYLAGAQAKRATELKEDIELFKKLKFQKFNDNTPIETTALIKVEVNGEEEKWFFMLPSQGGMKTEVTGAVVMTVTPDAPLGKSLFKKKVGDYFELVVGDNSSEYEITEVI